MDFWTRLLGGSSQRKQTAVHNPQQRLERFKRVYNDILQTWHKSASLAADHQAIANLRTCFQRLTSILNDESRSPAPHLCLSFAASQQIYSTVSKIASTAYHEAMVRDAVAVFGALIDSEEEDFLENSKFAESLMTFIGRITTSGSTSVGEDTDAEIVELLFGIAAKIRLQPDILPVWFTSDASNVGSRMAPPKANFAGVTQKEDFPLCYQLIDHVHHEGRIGDFARTGLLYIFESASKSKSLEWWIVGSDLPTLMATGLGALYSQLSRKLSIVHPADSLPLILAFSDYTDLHASTAAESLFSPDFQLHLDTFLSYLTFWQDVLEHCRSVDVRQTLIDHFQILFLQQLLYPSLLESSDVDGGSSVAVLTYLRRILDALDHAELVHMILNYLLARPDWGSPSKSPRSPLAAQRRVSLMLLNVPEDENDKMNPSLFNVVDLVLGSVRSTNPQTVIAALKLTTVIMSKHHAYAVGTLVKVVELHHKEPQRTLGALNAEMEEYLDLAISLGGESGVDEAYECHVKDKLNTLESHQCSMKSLALPSAPAKSPVPFYVESPRDVSPHYLVPEDPLWSAVLHLLKTFLTNDVETNLGLTEAVVHVGSCAQLRLEGWISVEPQKYQFDGDDGGAQRLIRDDGRDGHTTGRRPTWTPFAVPSLLGCLQGLRAQVDALRVEIPEFDEHVATRKETFRLQEQIEEATRLAATQTRRAHTSTEISAGTWTPQIPQHVRNGSSTSSRTQSPRGRNDGLDGNSTPAASPAPSRKGIQALIGSPSRGLSPLPRPRPTTLMADVLSNVAEVANVDALQQRIQFQADAATQIVKLLRAKGPPSSELASARVTGDQSTGEAGETVREASLNHVVTNVIILQEFVLEIVAMLQVRASLFHEVRFV